LAAYKTCEGVLVVGVVDFRVKGVESPRVDDCVVTKAWTWTLTSPISRHNVTVYFMVLGFILLCSRDDDGDDDERDLEKNQVQSSKFWNDVTHNL
jgi:hypothetical protein